MVNLSEIKEGQILRFDVTSESHEKRPYYVRVKEVGYKYFVTEIPLKHSLKVDRNNMDYHLSRIKIMGDESIYGDLLKNQRFIVKE